MKKLIIVTLLCCSLTGVSYGQGRSSNSGQDKPASNKQDKSTDGSQKEKESCTITEKGWKVDVGIGTAADKETKVECQRESGPALDGRDPRR